MADSAQFSPARLRVARQLNGLRQVQLAEQVELTAPSISQYESGVHVPGAPVLQRLAFALGFPREFFFTSTEAPTPTPAFFRSLRATPQLERDKAAAFAWLLARVVEAFEAHVKLPGCDLRLAIDLGATPTRSEIEEAAAQARAAWDVPPGPVANVVRLLEAHGAVVATFAAGDRRLSAFSQWHGERPIVVLCSDKADKARSRYDATHELGHLALHVDPEPGNNVLEQQAEEFASAFLMPADDIRPHLPHGRIDWHHLQRLKRTWGVSMQALLVRANRLGTISDRTFQNAFRYLSRQGWRRREPVDLGPLEEPQLLARAFALLETKGIEPVDLFGALALPQRYAVELVGDRAAGASADSGDVVALPRRSVTAAPPRNVGP